MRLPPRVPEVYDPCGCCRGGRFDVRGAAERLEARELVSAGRLEHGTHGRVLPPKPEPMLAVPYGLDEVTARAIESLRTMSNPFWGGGVAR